MTVDELDQLLRDRFDLGRDDLIAALKTLPAHRPWAATLTAGEARLLDAAGLTEDPDAYAEIAADVTAQWAASTAPRSPLATSPKGWASTIPEFDSAASTTRCGRSTTAAHGSTQSLSSNSSTTAAVPVHHSSTSAASIGCFRSC